MAICQREDYSPRMKASELTALSLFSSGGIGDLALRATGFEILVSCELLADRHSLYSRNFSSTTAITGDIWRELDAIERAARQRLCGRALTLLYATPPCQGMSKNGRGKLLSEIRAGRKPPLDARNRLILPTLELARRLQPEIVLFENVPEMKDTIILDENGVAVPIIDHVADRLGPAYEGVAEIVEFADYGVPQCRQRLITVFSRNQRMRRWLSNVGSFLPPRTHSPNGRNGTKRWVSVQDAIGHLPPLDAGHPALASSDIPYHRVPLLDAEKYWWIKHTRPERSAFDNQCVECGHVGNPWHRSGRDDSGINRASLETPLYCERCSSLLPRPCVERGGKRSIMRGFTSAYKRMSADRPASALTRNLSYACSDNKLHPTQHRVLSLQEAFVLHTISMYEYNWSLASGKRASDKLIREVIGESIPPWGLHQIAEHIKRIYLGVSSSTEFSALGPLFGPSEAGIACPPLR